ncbi:MAG: 30S ribosomal protein S1 [Candidatus Omnitrophota bacterium]
MTIEEINTGTLDEKDSATLDLSKAYEDSLRDIKEGQVIKGKIIALTPKEVLVDVGYKSEGYVSLEEFLDTSALKVGDEVEVLLESKEDDDGRVVLSKRKAERTQGWDRVVARSHEGDVVEGRVTKKVKGGLMVDIGVEAFLPASLISLKGFTNVNQFIGQPIKCKIIKINKARKNIVLSRKEVLQEETAKQRTEIFAELKKGDIRNGMVKNVTDFGAFIDLGGVDGLLHITDMGWGRVSHPNEIVSVGQKIDVMILDFDKESMKVSLGLKQLQPSPWEHVEEKYPVGTRVKGKVVNILPYGAFVEIERGLEGLVHISELSWNQRTGHPTEVVQLGQEVEAVVVHVDRQNQKLGLSMKDPSQDPWLSAEERYPVGGKVEGKVRSLTDYGAFVELSDGIDGLVWIQDMSWVRKVNHPKDILKKGQKVEAIVLSVDVKNRKLALGLRQLTPDPWPDLVSRYSVGSVLTGKITKVTKFGIFLELEQGVEGLVHISEIGPERSKNLEQTCKLDETVKAKVVKIDSDLRRIGLSLKNIEGKETK